MLLIRNVYVLNPSTDRGTPFEFYQGSILIQNGKIESIYTHQNQPPQRVLQNAEIFDGEFRKLVFPGFIQCHIHFCQTLHRNLAEQMPLIQWLKEQIWPYEASLTPHSMGQAVLMALKEVISSGTTSVLDMGTVHHQKIIFEIMQKTGFRYTGGKAMMDRCEGAPANLIESTEDSISESLRLYERFNKKSYGLLNYAFAPRFVLSCSIDLLREVRKISDQKGIIIETHASEHPQEVAYIKEKTGYGNVAYLDKINALNDHTVIAHMVNLDDDEKTLIKKHNLSIVHCPTTNLKLGSGIAPIAEYVESGYRVGLGADGAPCNNALSIFNEIKLAPLLQKGIHHDPLLMEPEDILRMVSVNGAKITRQNHKVGQIKEGLEADLVILDMDTPQTYNFQKNPAAAIVYGADARNVYATMVRGSFLYKNGKFSHEIDVLDAFYRPKSNKE